jgi:hypothetical protein
MVALYLTKTYGDTRWRNDPLAADILSKTDITARSLLMAIGNFRSLLNLGGLQNTSQAQRAIFVKYGALGTNQLREIATESLGRQIAAQKIRKVASSVPAPSEIKLAIPFLRKKYERPSFLQSRLTQEAYIRWLRRKAAAHVKRDKSRGNSAVKNEQYMIAIHRAVCESNGRDAYTHELLTWELISKYDNDASKAGRREYKAKFALLPTVDHVGDGKGAADFRICAWRTNDAKSDMTLKEFVELCRKVVEAHGATIRSPMNQ